MACYFPRFQEHGEEVLPSIEHLSTANAVGGPNRARSGNEWHAASAQSVCSKITRRHEKVNIIYMHVCMYVYIYIYVHICVYVGVCVYISIYIYMYVYVCVYFKKINVYKYSYMFIPVFGMFSIAQVVEAASPREPDESCMGGSTAGGASTDAKDFF